MTAAFDMRSLNERQRQVVTTTEGPVLVLAGAGTGKTRAVTCRVAYLLSRKKVPPSNILAVTFTNKAAGEMKERLVGLAGKKKAAELTVCTFHSLCVRLLRENARQAGLGKNFTIYDEKDQVGLIRAALREQRINDRGIDPATLLYRISGAKSDLIPPEKFTDKYKDKYGEISPVIYEAYQEMLQARNAVDFDDLIMKTMTLLSKHPKALKACHDRFRYIMVDESQDTSRAQYQLMEKLARGHHNICVVGDDDQSIYGWRGAQVSNIHDFQRDFKGTSVIRLEQNYRSTVNILQVANSVISRNGGRMEKSLWTQGPEGSQVISQVAPDEYAEAETVAMELAAFHKKFKLAYKDAAILYRSNAQSRVFEEELRKNRVPYKIVGGQSFYDRKEVRDLVAYLKLLHNPRDEASMLRIINVPRRGIGETTVARLVEAAHAEGKPAPEFLKTEKAAELASASAGQALKSFLQLIEKHRKNFSMGVLDQSMRHLLDDIHFEQDVRRSSKSDKEFVRRWENVMEVVNSLAAFVQEEKDHSLESYLERISLMTKDDKPDKDGPENAVTLMTIHSAKGLEFPLVYLVGMEEDLLPHARSMADGGDALNEERRLCYVGITRARKYLVLSRAESRRKYGKMAKRSPSRFLAEIPEEMLQARKAIGTGSSTGRPQVKKRTRKRRR